MELPKNTILKKLLYATTIAVVLCYAWLTARLLEPGFETPPLVVASVFYRAQEDIRFYDEVHQKLPIETARLIEETQWLGAKFQLIGDLKPAVRVVVDADNKDRLVVTQDRIEIGTEILRAKGQLKKAILKAWLLQRVSPDIAQSFLRVEVASDVLLAILSGGLQLEVPGNSETLSFEASPRDWWTYADSYQGLCKNGWRSLELQSLCAVDPSAPGTSASVTVSALSFRPFIGNQIWQSYVGTSASKRQAFAEAWLKSLMVDGQTGATVSGTTLSVSDLKAPSDPLHFEGWTSRLRSEISALLPQEIDVLELDRLNLKEKLDAPVIVIDGNGTVAAPGTLKLVTNEISIRKAKLAILTVCAAPTLRDITSLSVESDRIVWKPECAERGNDFIQIRPSSVKLAIAKGLAKFSDRLDTFVQTNSSDLLGLRDAKWDEAKQVFQVKAPIEAVELYRLGSSS